MLKAYPEDFFVREIFDLSSLGNSGPYAYYLLRKKNMNFFDAIHLISQLWKVSRDRIGFSGIKDKRAVTEQYISIKDGPEESIKLENLEVRFIGRGERAIRLGDARGNVFRVKLRDVEEKKIVRAFEKVCEIGFANYFGTQRFANEPSLSKPIGRFLIHGKFDEALKLYFHSYPNPRARHLIRSGWENLSRVIPLLRGVSKTDIIVLKRFAKKKDPEIALRAFPKPLKLMFLFSYQSLLWNRILQRLLREKTSTFIVKLKGGIIYAFYSEMTPSLRDLVGIEIPYISKDVFSLQKNEITDLIRKVIEEEKIGDFLEKKVLGLNAFSSGKRRAIVFPGEAKIVKSSRNSVVLEFFLPAGSYATVMLEKVKHFPTILQN